MGVFLDVRVLAKRQIISDDKLMTNHDMGVFNTIMFLYSNSYEAKRV